MGVKPVFIDFVMLFSPSPDFVCKVVEDKACQGIVLTLKIARNV